MNVDVSKPSQLKDLLARHGFAFKKQLGQNFLIDPRILDMIVDAAELAAADGAFEIGPGAGVVTQRLCRAARRVVAVEKDTSLLPVLADSLAEFDNAEVITGDVLHVSLPEVWERFADCDKVSVVANLPYYVTTPILFHILESAVRWNNIVVMVQREVAERMCAEPGGKDYGALSVAVQYYAIPEKVVKVTPGSFMPSPGVESMVVRLACRSVPAVHVDDEAAFFKVVRAAFAMRRKTLLNTLSANLGVSKDACATLLEGVGVDSRRRGETLSQEEFAAIANAYSQSRG